MQVIEANAQGVDRIPFLCDNTVSTLEVGQGCKELRDNVQQIGPDVFARDPAITDARPRRNPDAGVLALVSLPRRPTDPAEREYRRAVMRRVDNLDMRIEFHPSRLPAQVWWAHWDGIEGEVIQREAVTLDSQCSVHRYLRSVDKTVVGFYWQWE